VADVSRSRPRKRFGLRGAANAAPRKVPDPPKRVLLATAAIPISPEVLARTVELASPEHARITVVSVARVYGTSLGFPNPGLQPNRLEIEQNKRIIEEAAAALRKEGFDVRVAMSKSRNAPKMIARWAKAKNFHAIVVPDPERPRWRRTLEGDIAREIERRCGVPVHAVSVPPTSRRSPRAS
jgi:K+-sensing histidine kinase KdpD